MKIKNNINEENKYLFTSRDLYKLIIPLVLEQLLEVIVGMSDSIMIASVGESAVSGVSLMDNIYILLINVFTALATGGAVVVGQYMGRKDIKKARESACLAYVFCIPWNYGTCIYWKRVYFNCSFWTYYKRSL